MDCVLTQRYDRITLLPDRKEGTLTELHITILSCSLSENSRSRLLCRHAEAVLHSVPCQTTWMDLREHRVLPHGMDGSEGIDEIRNVLDTAAGILIGFPVYNYTMNSSLKTVIERFGRSMENKIVGLMMAAGGRASYMSSMDVAASLMFDFRTWIAPRSVYATSDDFDDDRTRIDSDEIRDRVEELSLTVATRAWQHAQQTPFG